MSRAISCLVITAISLTCGGGCLYFNQPVTFSVRDAETKQPIAGAQIEQTYMGLFVPRGTSGKTDASGQLTLSMDPTQENLRISARADGYQSQEGMWGVDVKRCLVSRSLWEWRSDFILDMYKEPVADMDLVIPNGYRGVVLIRFSPVDKPPQQIGQRHFTYVVGPNGMVEVPQMLLLNRHWGRVHGRFVDGTAVKTIDDKDWTESGSVALRFITPVWEHYTWVYVLGTRVEADAIQTALWGDGNHFDEERFLKMCESKR